MAGSVYKYQTTKNGIKWMYMLDVGKDEHGKRKQKKKSGFKTEKEAKKALKLAEAEVYNGVYIHHSKILFGEYVINWLENKKISLQKQTYTSQKYYINKYIVPKLGFVPLADLRKDHIQKLINSMCEIVRENGKVGYSPETTKKVVKIISASLETACQEDLIKKNVSKNVILPKSLKRTLNLWTKANMNTFIETASDDKLYCAFYLALSTGMRQAEILGLRWQDIDFIKRELHIRQVLSHDGKDFYPHPKSKASERTIGLTESTIKVLKDQKLFVNQEKLKNGKSYQDLDLVNCTSIGTPISPRNLLRSFSRLTEKANLHRIRFHDLRHTHATFLLSEGVNIKVISERLGHSNIKVTLDIYSHVLPSMQKEALNILEDKIGL